MSSDDIKAAAEPTGAPLGGRASTTTEDPAGRAPTRRPKPRRLRDMLLSLAVLLVPLGIFYGIWNWAAVDRQVSVVDTSEDYLAAESLGIEVVRPDLSENWKPISSVLATEGEAVTLRTGWYTPEGFGMQLVQTTGAVDDVNEALTGGGDPVEAGGLEWSAYETAEGRAWVTVLETSTVVLTAEQDAIDELPELAEGVAAALP